jgi:hypothetical protein
MGVDGLPTAIVTRMSRHATMIRRLMSGESDHDFRFDDLCAILRRLGFAERNRSGSHHIFSRSGIPDILNLQPGKGWLAKPYQVRQVRRTLLEYGFVEGAEDE